MSLESARSEMREKLIDDLKKAIDSARVDIGMGLNQAEVLGCIEIVKYEYLQECLTDDEN